jgi:hypothetical protein
MPQMLHQLYMVEAMMEQGNGRGVFTLQPTNFVDNGADAKQEINVGQQPQKRHDSPESIGESFCTNTQVVSDTPVVVDHNPNIQPISFRPFSCDQASVV